MAYDEGISPWHTKMKSSLLSKYILVRIGAANDIYYVYALLFPLINSSHFVDKTNCLFLAAVHEADAYNICCVVVQYNCISSKSK